MKPDVFRTLALSLPGTVESSHHDHPDFRVAGRIFATLGYPDGEWGMVRLPADEQARVCRVSPEVFVKVKGAWGRDGATQVNLDRARTNSIRAALKTAWTYRQAKRRSTARRRTAPR